MSSKLIPNNLIAIVLALSVSAPMGCVTGMTVSAAEEVDSVGGATARADGSPGADAWLLSDDGSNLVARGLGSFPVAIGVGVTGDSISVTLPGATFAVDADDTLISSQISDQASFEDALNVFSSDAVIALGTDVSEAADASGATNTSSPANCVGARASKRLNSMLRCVAIAAGTSVAGKYIKGKIGLAIGAAGGVFFCRGTVMEYFRERAYCRNPGQITLAHTNIVTPNPATSARPVELTVGYEGARYGSENPVHVDVVVTHADGSPAIKTHVTITWDMRVMKARVALEPGSYRVRATSGWWLPGELSFVVR